MTALTGWQINGKDLLEAGQRVNNLQRLFNIREGLGKNDGLLLERVLQRPLFGVYQNEDQCIVTDYKVMLKKYYLGRGWDIETGTPTKEKISELKLQ